jgi:hypothetical protein
MEEIDADENAGEEVQRRHGKRVQKPLQPSEELAAVIGSSPPLVAR